jgi:cell wall-associated NlpC family hydrolase
MQRSEIVARARALIGVRFRLQGRDPEFGLDCIGVVMMAARIPRNRVRRDYGLHSCDPEQLNAEFDWAGFVRIAPAEAEEGDVLVVRPGPTALHVVILTGSGYLHADARLRKVVEVPGEMPWPTVSAWRHPDDVAEDMRSPALRGPSRRLH